MVKAKTSKAKAARAATPFIRKPMPHDRAAQGPSTAGLERADWRDMLMLAGLLLLARMAYVAWLSPYGLGPDEAQYWHWTTHMDWSYLSKPPLTTWLIWLGTAIVGVNPLGVKLFALLGQGAVAVLGFALAAEVVSGALKRPAAWLAFLALTTVPLVAAGGLLMSPDAVMLPLWMAALYLLAREANAGRMELRRWVAIGVLIGLAGLAKYTAGLFFPLLGVFMLVERRAWFRQRGPYVAGVIALAMQAPVVYWNMAHGWSGAAHLAWQADGGGDGRHGGLATMGEFLINQALVLGPLTFGLMLMAWYAWGRYYRQMPVVGMRLLGWFTLPVFAGFLAQTLMAKVQPNWPLLGTVPALVMVAVSAAACPRRWQRGVLVAGLVVNLVASLALHDTFALRAMGVNLPLKADPTKDMMGTPQLGRMVGVLLERLQAGTVVVTTRYQTTAQLAFQIPGRPTVLYLNDGTRRANEYDLWPWPPLDGRLALYINEQDVLPDAVKGRFSRCEPWQKLRVEEGGMVVRQASTWLCWNTALAGL